MIQAKVKPWLALLPLIWIAVIVSLYFVIHKPIDLNQAFQLGLALWRILAGFFLLSICGGLGMLVYPASDYHPLTRLAVQVSIGLGIVGLVLLGIGVTIGYKTVWMLVAAIIITVIVLRPMLRWWRLWAILRKHIMEGDGFEKTVFILTGLILLLTLFRVLAPPVKFDALVYHLTLPQSYLRTETISYLPWLMFWGMPQTIEMLFTAGMILAGGEGAATFGWFVGLTASIGILGLTYQYFGGRAAWVAVAGLYSSQTLASSLAWGYVEWGSILLGLSFVAVLSHWVQVGNRRDVILAGVLAGFAIGIKYTSGVLFLAGLSVLAWNLLFRKQSGIREFLTFSLAGFLIVLPWLIKNFMATGNPIYPFLVPAGAMDEIRLELFQGFPIWGNWRTVLALPLEATILGVEGAPGFGVSIGPLFLAFSVLCWIGWRSRSEGEKVTIQVAGIIALVGVTLWALASRFSGYLIQTRLYISLIPSVAFLSGAGFDSLDRIKAERFRPGWVAGFLVLLVLTLNLFNLAAVSLKDGVPAYLIGLKSADTYLFENLGWYYPATLAAVEIAGDSQILMLWEPRSYYCAPNCRPDEVIDRWLRDFRRLGDRKLVWQSWLKEGFSHLLLNRGGMEFVRQDDTRYTAQDWEELDLFLDEITFLEDFGGVYQIYDLSP